MSLKGIVHSWLEKSGGILSDWIHGFRVIQNVHIYMTTVTTALLES